MKRYYLSAILALIISYPVYADKQAITVDGDTVILKDDGTWVIKSRKTSARSDYAFRKANWGMSKAQVKATESGEPEREDDSFLGYGGRIANMDALIAYIFAENKLVMAKYLFIEKHSNKNDFIMDYNNLKESIEKEHGKPKDEDKLWRSNLYKNDYSQWGFAVSVGHLVYFSKWETKETDIGLILSGENYRIRLVAQYSSKLLKQLMEKVTEKKRANEF